MRKPRDYDAELKALDDKARQLKHRKVQQLGELVTATGADALSIEELAGALLAMVSTTEPARREAWRKRGAAFFSGERAGTSGRPSEGPGGGAGGDERGAAAQPGSAPSSARSEGPA
ncbi:conjugal transfer protein TraD [Novosphingobium sp. 9]|uniref:conjugal transfer protein TraD n=1 Tax=Novosphingobium sp. 9 TaxID=2025349 RepID=UPI0021B69E01|nr:conjugal transfer protein TraD [Novosphingobium sp. 9]